MYDSKNIVTESNNPILALFALYSAVMDTVHPYQLLYSVQQDLLGLKQCILRGPNEDKTPSHNMHDYYSWMAWKKFTLILMDKTWTVERFRETAMKQYISLAHSYLKQLQLIPEQQSQQ